MPSGSGPVQDSSDDVTVPGDRVVPNPALRAVELRRNAGLSALVGGAASAVGIAYLWRAAQTLAVLDWTLCALLCLIAGVFLSALVDSRTPLLVADELGVRIRFGREWRGLPWEALDRVVVAPRRHLWRDGRLLVAPRHLARSLEGIEGRARRQVLVGQKLYGAPLALPLGLSTRVVADGDLADALTRLAAGRTEVQRVEPPVESAQPAGSAESPGGKAADLEDRETPTRPEPEDAASSSRPGAVLAERWRSWASRIGGTVHEGTEEADTPETDPDDLAQPPEERPREGLEPRRPRVLGGIGTIVSRVTKVERARGAGDHKSPAPDQQPLAPAARAGSATPSPLRETRPGARTEVRRDLPTTLGSTAPQLGDDATRRDLPEGRELHRPGSVDLVEPAPWSDQDRVRPISRLGDAVEPLVIDEFETEPAYDPVIGPELAAARTRVGLTVDALAERTRIRPHVIESIEVDDFAPCGGDFYARGHLRTLARVLGKDPQALVATFDERYATAPISPRRVFEAELATGMTGSMRSTLGGPNWGLLVGVVLLLVMTWGVARLVTDTPTELQSPAPVLNGSSGLTGSGAAPQQSDRGAAPAARAVHLRLVAAHGDAHVVVRDRDRTVVFSGDLASGERQRVHALAPLHVRVDPPGTVVGAVHGHRTLIDHTAHTFR